MVFSMYETKEPIAKYSNEMKDACLIIIIRVSKFNKIVPCESNLIWFG